MDIFISKLTAKSQTVIPAVIRKKLGLKPGDTIRYKEKNGRVEIEKLIIEGAEREDDPFYSFTEWASDHDDTAFKDL